MVVALNSCFATPQISGCDLLTCAVVMTKADLLFKLFCYSLVWINALKSLIEISFSVIALKLK